MIKSEMKYGIAPKVWWVFLWLCLSMGMFNPIVWAGQDDCETKNATRTFFQVWRFHANYSSTQWHEHFMDMQRHGFSEVILQWSSYGKVSYFYDHRPGREVSLSLPMILQEAKKAGLKVWLGLHYDPDFWDVISAEEKREDYLRERIQDLEKTIPLLVRVIEREDPDRKVVAGWYISDEVDDSNWRDVNTQPLLTEYLRGVSERLKSATPEYPVLISSYLTGKMSPTAYGNLCKKILAETFIDTLLLQDSVGTGKMSLPKLKLYLENLKKVLVDSEKQLGIIVELFEMAHKNSKKDTVSADFNRVKKQLALAGNYGVPQLTVFAAADHLLGDVNKTLSDNWRQDRAQCSASATSSSAMNLLRRGDRE
jgi:hypothetical protein